MNCFIEAIKCKIGGNASLHTMHINMHNYVSTMKTVKTNQVPCVFIFMIFKKWNIQSDFQIIVLWVSDIDRGKAARYQMSVHRDYTEVWS